MQDTEYRVKDKIWNTRYRVKDIRYRIRDTE